MRKFYISQVDLFLTEFVDSKLDEEKGAYEFEDTLTEEQFNKLKEFIIDSNVNRDYFDCLIDDKVRKVRFGVVSHKKTSNAIIVRGPIIEDSYDKNLKSSRYENDYKKNIEKEVMKTRIINDRLISLLLEKEIVSKEEIDQITKVSSREIQTKYFDYNTF